MGEEPRQGAGTGRRLGCVGEIRCAALDHVAKPHQTVRDRARGPRFQIPLGLPSGILRLARRRLGLGDVAVPHDLLRERDLDSRLLERLLQASVHLAFQTPLSPGLGFGL